MSGVGAAYAADQFNGNIAGMLWKSRGDGAIRKYDFTYDAVNRLTGADFNQYASTAFNKSAGIDFSVSNLTYDANGNISSMSQQGWKLTGSATIDQLSYNYFANSNKLQSVTDAVGSDNKLGDFTDKNTSGADYGYDVNGNLVTDLNKRINGSTGMDLASGGAITYNHLNLPASIAVKNDDGSDKGSIGYVYDAAGNKLKKVVHESGKNDVTTVYGVGNYVNDTLQFLPQEEGRIRLLAGSNSPVYDYFIKDHLGNVRMVLTEGQKQDVYPAATLEDVVYNGGKAIDVESQFYYVDPNKVVASSGVAGLPTYQNNNGNPPYNSVNPYSNTSANSTKVYLTNANSNKMGLGIILKVMAGDKVNIYGKSYHKRPPGQGYKDAVSPLTVLDILNAFSGTALITAKGVSSGDISSRPGFPNSVAGLVGNQPGQSKNQPKASIDWILFDEQFGYAGGGFDMVGAENTSNGTFKEHNLNTIPTITVPKNGYIYVYCANESQYDVFFDNLQVIHTRGPIVEETHYYPFGLTMAGISSKAMTFGGAANKYKYNGMEEQRQEFSDGSGLEMYEYKFRFYDQQIGRFISQDKLADEYVYYSPYQFAGNEVPNAIDLDGLEPLRPSGRYMSSNQYPDLRRSYRAVNSYVPNPQSYRTSERFIPNQASGSASTPANIYEPFRPGTGDQFVGPTITQGNSRGRAVVALTKLTNEIHKFIEKIDVSIEHYSNGTHSNSFVQIIWNNKEAEKQFNSAQNAYNQIVLGIESANSPGPAPDPNKSTPAERQAYTEKVQKAQISINFQTLMLGPSPQQQILNSISSTNDYELKSTKTTPLPEFKQRN